MAIKVGDDVANTSTKQDTFNPTWNIITTQSWEYSKIVKMSISLVDEDFSSNDSMVTWGPENNRWYISNPKEQKFKLETKDDSITLYIAIRCTF